MNSRALVTVAATFSAIVGIFQGCSSSSSSPPTATKVTQVVGASGGVVATPDGNVSVAIPAGALPNNVTITVTSNPAPAALSSSESPVGTAYTFEPDGLVFAVPVTVTLAFDPSKIPSGATSANVVVLSAPDHSTTYSRLPSKLADSTHVSGTTTHFCTDIPAVVVDDAADATIDDASLPPTDAGILSDAAPDASTCAVSCGVAGGEDGGSDAAAPLPACSATCDGISYKLSCDATSCTCSKNGVTTATPTLSAASNDTFGTYSSSCGFPGALAGCEQSVFCYVGQVAGGGGDGGDDGGGGVPGCTCYSGCGNTYFYLSCTQAGACTCAEGYDQSNMRTLSNANACTSSDTTFAVFSGSCHYPGTQPVPPEAGVDGGDGG